MRKWVGGEGNKEILISPSVLLWQYIFKSHISCVSTLRHSPLQQDKNLSLYHNFFNTTSYTELIRRRNLEATVCPAVGNPLL